MVTLRGHAMHTEGNQGPGRVMGKILALRQPRVGKRGLRQSVWEGWLAGPASPQSQRRPRGEGRVGWRLSPTKHRQCEQEVLPQLVAQPQPQGPVLGLLRAELAVVHAHFDLLGHVVGTETEVKAVVRDCWAPPASCWRDSGSSRRNRPPPRHNGESGNIGKKIKK